MSYGDGWGAVERWDPPAPAVVLSGGPVEARFEDNFEPVVQRYVGFKASNQIESEPLLWDGDQA